MSQQKANGTQVLPRNIRPLSARSIKNITMAPAKDGEPPGFTGVQLDNGDYLYKGDIAEMNVQIMPDHKTLAVVIAFECQPTINGKPAVEAFKEYQRTAPRIQKVERNTTLVDAKGRKIVS